MMNKKIKNTFGMVGNEGGGRESSDNPHPSTLPQFYRKFPIRGPKYSPSSRVLRVQGSPSQPS